MNNELPFILAMANFSPMLIAVLLAWIVCVTIHEFSHALVAYFGGDKSMRERGYLSLDPTKFIDPVMSLLIPAVVLLMGGFPLPGASVPVDRSLLRNEKWEKLVSAAGPASNFILFLLFAAILHPVFGLIDPNPANQPTWVWFIAAMAYLNLFAVFLNLIPIPPLDGFGIIEHQFDPQARETMRRNSTIFLMMLFGLFFFAPQFIFPIFNYMMDTTMTALGFDFQFFLASFHIIRTGQIPEVLTS